MRKCSPIAFSPSLTGRRLRAAPDVESRRRIGLGLQMSANKTSRAARFGHGGD